MLKSKPTRLVRRMSCKVKTTIVGDTIDIRQVIVLLQVKEYVWFSIHIIGYPLYHYKVHF